MKQQETTKTRTPTKNAKVVTVEDIMDNIEPLATAATEKRMGSKKAATTKSKQTYQTPRVSTKTYTYIYYGCTRLTERTTQEQQQEEDRLFMEHWKKQQQKATTTVAAAQKDEDEDEEEDEVQELVTAATLIKDFTDQRRVITNLNQKIPASERRKTDGRKQGPTTRVQAKQRKNIVGEEEEEEDEEGEEEEEEDKDEAVKSSRLIPNNPVKVHQNRRKFELGIVYIRQDTGKMGARKLFFGEVGNDDVRTVSKDVLTTQRQQWDRLLVSSAQFDPLLFEFCGGFLNGRFWDVNISWGLSTNLNENLEAVNDFLRKRKMTITL